MLLFVFYDRIIFDFFVRICSYLCLFLIYECVRKLYAHIREFVRMLVLTQEYLQAFKKNTQKYGKRLAHK